MDRHCDFCGKSEKEIKKMVEAQPNGKIHTIKTNPPRICNECVLTALEVMLNG